MTLEQRLYLGNRAREVIENEAFIAAFLGIEQEVIDQWTNSPARDVDGRERLWSYLTLLRKVKAHLQTTLETGKLAEVELTYQRSLMDRAKDAIGMRL